jgi:hypothetical protein
MLLEFMSFIALSAQSQGTGTFLTKLLGPGAVPPPRENLGCPHTVSGTIHHPPPVAPASYDVYVDPFWIVTVQWEKPSVLGVGPQANGQLAVFVTRSCGII